MISQTPLWGPSPVLAFSAQFSISSFIFSWQLKERKQCKPRAKTTQSEVWSLPSRQGKAIHECQAGRGIIDAHLHSPSHPQRHVPYFAVFQTSCRSARGTSLYCHSSQQLSPAAPQPRWLALAPEIALCSFSSGLSPLWLPGFGLKGSRES